MFDQVVPWKRLVRGPLAVLLLTAGLALPTSGEAEEVVACPPEADAVWVGGSEWDFEDPENWQDGVVPPDGADVCVLRAAASPTIDLSISEDHRFVRLVADAPVDLSGSLQLDGPLTSVVHSLDVAPDGTLSVPAGSATLTVPEDLRLEGTLEVRGPLDAVEGPPVVVEGMFRNYADWQLDFGWRGGPSGEVSVTDPDTVPTDGVALVGSADEFVLGRMSLTPTTIAAHLSLRDRQLVLEPGAAAAELELAVVTTAAAPFAGMTGSDLYVTVRNTGTQTATAGVVSLFSDVGDGIVWDTEARCTVTELGAFPAVCRVPALEPGNAARLHFLVAPTNESVPDREAGGTLRITAHTAALESVGSAEPLELSYPVAPAPQGVDRIAGANRIETAVALSRFGWSDPDELHLGATAGAAVLAQADDFPDALVAAPLARFVGGPLLLTDTARLSAATAAELVRILPAGTTVHIVGGPMSISDEVVRDLEALGYETDRIAGANRYATAAAVASNVSPLGGIWLADGTRFPDAVVAGGAAAALANDCCHVVLLTNGATLPAETAAIVDKHTGGDGLFAVGGAAAAAVPRATPYVGADRYETAAAVAEARGFQSFLVTGSNWPDALAVGARGGAILLVPQTGQLPASVQALLATRNRMTIVGGTAAVSQDVAEQIANALNIN